MSVRTIEELEAEKAKKEKELDDLKKEIENVHKTDLKVRFNMVEGKFYKITNSIKTTYFKFTEGNAYIKDNYFFINNCITKSVIDKTQNITFSKFGTYYDLSPKSTVCLNNNEKVIAENDSYSLIFNPNPDPNPYESLKNLFTESLYDKKISITEATDEELKNLKDEIDKQMKDILN